MLSRPGTVRGDRPTLDDNIIVFPEIPKHTM